MKASRVKRIRSELALAVLERDQACSDAIGAGASYRAVSEATGVDMPRLFHVRKRDRT